MQVIQLTCPNCHGELEIEDSYEICYCKYCGTKILITEQNEAAIKAKTELQMKREDNALERFRLEKEHEEKKRSEIFGFLALFGILLIGILTFLIH